MSVFDRIGVEPGERAFFTRAGLCLLLLSAASMSLQNAAETLFLKRVGVEHLPVAFLLCSVILVGGTALAGRLLSSVDRPRWLPWLMSGLGLTLVPVWVLVYAETPGILWALVILVQLLESIGLLVYWVSLGDLITPRQAKRLFAPLAAGATIGRLLGSFGTQPASLLAGIEGVVLISAALYVLAAVACVGLRPSGPAHAEPAAAAPRSQPTRSGRGIRRGPRFGRIWGESRLFRLLVIWAFCAGALGPMLYFQFSYALNLATAGPGGEQALIALYSQFRGWLYFLILLTQLTLSARLYRRFGIPLMAALWPFTFLVGFFWLGVTTALRPALVTLAAVRLEGNAVARPGLNVLQNLLPARLRPSAISWIEGPIGHLGGATGNGLVLGAIALSGASLVSVPAVPIALVWFTAATVLWRLYPSLLLQAASNHRLSLSDDEMADLLDTNTIRKLAGDLTSPDPDVCRAAAELIAGAEPTQAAGVLAEALEVAPPQMRLVLTDALQTLLEHFPPGEIRNPDANEALARLLERRAEIPPDQRADLLQVYARLTGGASPLEGSEAVLDAALSDPEAGARLAAMAELERRRRPPPGLRDLEAALELAFCGGDVLMRRTARKELRATLLSSQPGPRWNEQLELMTAGLSRRVDRAAVAEAVMDIARRHGAVAAVCADAMLPHLHSDDPTVRAAVLAFIGHAGLAEHADDLVVGLASADEHEAAGAAAGLVALGSQAVGPLVDALRFDEGPFGDRVLETLVGIGVESELLAELLERSLAAARSYALQLASLTREAEGEASGHLLARRLGERVEEELRACLCIVGAIEGDARVPRLARRLQDSADPHQRAILVEAIEAVLAGEDRRDLMPLLESRDALVRGEVAAAQMNTTVPAAAEAWEALGRDPDELVRWLRDELGPPWLEGDAAMEDTPGMQPMETMQVATYLQRVPGFERLSTRQLVSLAGVVKEQRCAAGEWLSREGEEGTHLFVLVEGEVSVQRGGREIDRLGPGALVGEISMLDGGVRSESARAECELVAFAIDRSEILALMSEAPGLGLGFSQLLALRLRSLHERLDRAAET